MMYNYVLLLLVESEVGGRLDFRKKIAPSNGNRCINFEIQTEGVYLDLINRKLFIAFTL